MGLDRLDIIKRQHATLDALIESNGAEWMHRVLMDGISSGASCAEISEQFDMVPWWIILKWIEENCAEDIALAYRARADMYVDRATEVAMNAEVETLGADKLKVDHLMKLAGKVSRAKYGERTEVAVTNTHVVDIRGLLEKRELRLVELNAPIEGEVLGREVEL